MRKLFLLTVTLLGILASLSSCKHDDVMNVSINDEQMVSICVTIPDSETRASETNSAQGIFNNNVLGVENDNNTMRYILQIFDETGRPSDETLIEYSDGTTVSFPVRLVPGRDYTFVVWADFVTNGETNTDNHYITKDANGKTDLRNITINEDSWVAMDETRDAFTGIYSTKAAGEKYSSASTINVVLTRPFAKLRVVTIDMEALANLGINPTHAILEYTTPYRAGFNALTCTPFEADQNNIKVHQRSITEAYAIVAYGDNTAANKVLFTDYLFASVDQNDVVKFNLSVYENADKSGHIKTNSFTTDIAVKRNHLTTITGSILTEGNNVEVVVNPVFVGNENVDVDDLLNSTEPASNEIWYTSVDGNVVTPNTDAFNVDVVSNTYLNGRGVIRLAGVVTEIGDSAFNNCDNLKTLNINDSIISIGQNAFSGCDALSQIVIPGNIETIGYKAFENCTNVSSIIIEAGNTNLRLAYSFDGIPSTTLYVDRDIYGGYNNSPFENVGITTISIGPNMKNIDMFVFSNCKNIQRFNIDRNSQLETIGYCAFYNSNITGLHIPSSITKIDNTAFAMTTGLGWFTGGSSIYWVGMNGELAYEEASLRTLLRWPSEFSYASVIVSSYYYDKIGSYSFAGIDNLKHCIIAMYDGETIEIGNSAFYHCDNLESFNTVNEPSSTKVNISAIGSNVFANTAIKELNFLDSSFSTVNGTFRNCLNLETLYLPKTVAQIGEEAFANCSNLVNMFIAATNPPSLSADAFNIISDRMTIYVPVESYYDYISADGWKDLKNYIVAYDFENKCVVTPPANTIIFPPSNEIWYTSTDGQIVTPSSTNALGAIIVSNTYENGKGIIAFDGDIETIEDVAFHNRDNLESITLPNSLITIGAGAFQMCDNLNEVVMPNSVTKIYPTAFSMCYSLSKIELSDNLSVIGGGCFYGCDFTDITIPSSVTYIGEFALDCNVENIYCESTIPPTLTGDLCQDLYQHWQCNKKIYVPMNSVDLYKSAQNWSDYADKIVGYNFE